MIDNLFTAVFNKFNVANDFKTAVNSQLFPYHAKQDATYPYAVYMLVANVPEYTFNTQIEDSILQFTIADNNKNSPATILDAQDKLWTLFDDTVLTVTGYTNIYMRRQSSRLLRDGVYWLSHTDYKVMNDKN